MKRKIKINKSNLLDGLEARRLMATFNVSTAEDNKTSEPVFAGSLREAITLANATPGADTINFTIPLQGSTKLELDQPLPAITESLTIDGTTVAGYVIGKRFEINHSIVSFSNYNTLDLQAPSTVRGLAVVRANSSQAGYTLGNGIRLSPGSDGSTIEWNYLGLASGQVAGSGNKVGVYVGSNGNTVRNNVISGNTGGGVVVAGSNNVIAGNMIGVDANGNSAKSNGGEGVKFVAGATANVVGGPLAADRNIISGNITGVAYDSINDQTIVGNVVEGNYIGTNSTGSAVIANNTGIGMNGGKDGVIRNNVISGSVFSGITFGTSKAQNTVIQGNRIGMNAEGTAALLNGDYAINVTAGIAGLKLGTSGQGNWLVSGGGSGKAVVNLSGNDEMNVSGLDIKSNVFGILPNGNLAGDAGYGIWEGSTFGPAVIGGPNPVDGNKFAGQSQSFIYVSDNGELTLRNNWFGLSLDGTTGLGTTALGVKFDTGGVISNNKFARAGILLSSNGGSESYTGNTFGLNAAGTAVVSGTSIGLDLPNTGGDTQISGNTFAGMTGRAIFMNGGAVVVANKFGTDVTGMIGLTTARGVDAMGSNVQIGGVGQGNLFGKITSSHIDLADSTDAIVAGNTIGMNLDGSTYFASSIGVDISASSHATVGGSLAGEGNIIVGAVNGIDAQAVDAFLIQGNTIGLPGKPNQTGIHVADAGIGQIGGDVAGAGNTIAYNSGRAVALSADAGDKVTIRRNAIHSNAGMAIDGKGDNAVTANDAMDADAGMQNFPLLLSADSNGGSQTVVHGLINSSASTPLVIDFYSADANANEARVWLGSKTLLTDNAGGAVFTHNLPFVYGNKYIVATATNIAGFPVGSTSELSPSVQVAGPADTTSPTVSNSSLEFETAQKVKLVFSEDLNTSSVAAHDLTMTNTTTGQAFVSNSVNYDPATKTARFGFAGVLPDGNYTYSLGANKVTDVAGNGNAAFNDTTFVLAGDTNRDRTVNFDDLLKLAQNYGGSGKTFSQGDSNYDGKVNFDDLLALAQRYGTSLFSATPIEATQRVTRRSMELLD